MPTQASVEIPIRIECNPTRGHEGERWDVVDVIDTSNERYLGCIGVYEIDLRYRFPDSLSRAVVNSLIDAGRIPENDSVRYAITIQVYDGCEKLAEHTQIMIPRMGKLVRVDSQQLNSFFMLSELGFEHEDPFLPNGDFLLALDLGNLYLQAGSGLNARFVPVVNVWGTHHTGRTLTEIKIELPTEIASREHLLALLTFFLLHQLGQDFEPNFHTELIQEGKTLTHLLPRQFRAGMKG